MKSIRSIVRPVAVALVFAFASSAAPLTALAADRVPVAETKKKESRFPMKAESFNKVIDKRIAKMRERLTQMLANHKVPESVQAQAKKDFDDGAVIVRAAATRVGADGTVTKDEAKEVRDLAKDMKRKARAKYLPGKGKGKGRDHKKSENVG